jgi:putative CocE/NonD family hydrolase
MRRRTLTVLIALGLAARLAAQPTYAVKIELDQRVPMRDGATLSADVYRPDAPGKFPVILVRTPYDNAAAAQVARGKFWASRGYVYVVQDVRGRGESDGEFYPLIHEATDGDDTVTWCAGQHWSTGNVGTFGASYLGWTQGYLATIPNPHLKTMIMVVTPPDPWRNIPWQFGAFSPSFVSWLANVSGRTMQDISEYDLASIFRSLPLRDMDLKLGRRMKAWRDWLDHPVLDAYWKAQGYQEKLLATKVPILHISGWYDDVLVGTTENYINLSTRAADPGERSRQWLIVGPWPHAVNTVRLGAVDFGSGATIDYDAVQLRWFDHWLKGIDNGVDREPKVRVYVMGENRWRQEAEWPLARAQYTKYYLHSGGRANSSIGDGTLGRSSPDNEAPDRYRYDPADPTPFLGLDDYHQVGGPDDYRAVERRDDVLVYTSAAAGADGMAVCGPLTVHVAAASSAKDTDFLARLLDVYPGGYAQRLNDGIVRARYRKGFDRVELLEPGKIEEYDIDLWSTCDTLLPGHRLRLEIASSGLPKFDRNTNTGGPIGDETKGVVANQTVYHDRAHPSYVVLPLIPPR